MSQYVCMLVCFFIYLLDYKMLDLSHFPYISNQQILKHVLIINVAMVNPAASVLWWLWYLFCRRWFLSQTHFMIFSFTGRYFIFLISFSVRLLSALRDHSVFSSPPQRPMTSDIYRCWFRSVCTFETAYYNVLIRQFLEIHLSIINPYAAAFIALRLIECCQTCK